MRVLLYFSLLNVLVPELILHRDLGLSLEQKNDIFVKRKKEISTNVLIPLQVEIPNGPYQAETQARYQTEVSKIINDLGVNNYHINNTRKSYECDSIRELVCPEDFSKAKLGKFIVIGLSLIILDVY